MKIEKNGFLSIEQLQNQYLNRPRQTEGAEQNTELSFQNVFRQKLSNAEGTPTVLRFSKHAAGRLMDRNISLSDSQMERLSDGARKAGEKGIRDSLVVVDQLAFIVNIPKQTVITAMDQTEADENIFTNIDGAVFM